MKQTKYSVDWLYVSVGGVFAVRVIKLWAIIFRSPTFKVDLVRPILPDEPTFVVSNHQTFLDPPAVFSCLSMRNLIRMSPVKFMTWHKYYNGKFKFPLYTTGCYPSHGEGLSGVDAAVHYANNSYRSFIFPEGRRILDNHKTPAYPGIVRALEKVPTARLLLVRINWEKRTSLFSRPKLYVHMFDAPDNLDKSNADKIMDAIYNG